MSVKLLKLQMFQEFSLDTRDNVSDTNCTGKLCIPISSHKRNSTTSGCG